MGVLLIHRAIGTVAMTLAAWQVGGLMGRHTEQPRNAIMGMATGVVLGFLLTPFVVTRPFEALRRKARSMPGPDLLSVVLGLLGGLLVAALLAFPLSLLPWWFGRLVPALAVIVCAYLGISLMLERRNDLAALFRPRSPIPLGAGVETQYLLDTSAIIDGRIADIVHAGFVHGTLLVPRYVLMELQHIADSPDQLRRNRGRRGLDVLHRLQKESATPVLISDKDYKQIGEVDGKLVQSARDLGVPVITNDYNLNRIAELQGVRVLNINQLANALKAIVLPGEEMCVHVVQEGKELNQGLAYLDDGTMIVVENGRRFLNSNVDIAVTRVLQTSAGRMIFAHPKAVGGPQ
jgi:uncharacterized protein YacL